MGQVHTVCGNRSVWPHFIHISRRSLSIVNLHTSSFLLRIIRSHDKLHTIAYLLGDVHAANIVLHTGIENDTLLIGIIEWSHICGLLSTARCAYAVFVHLSELTDLILPVNRSHILIVIECPWSSIRMRIPTIEIHRAISRIKFILKSDKFIRWHHFIPIIVFRQAITVLEINFRSALWTGIGSNNNHTISTACTIYGCRRCIFKYLDTFNILSRNWRVIGRL